MQTNMISINKNNWDFFSSENEGENKMIKHIKLETLHLEGRGDNFKTGWILGGGKVDY